MWEYNGNFSNANRTIDLLLILEKKSFNFKMKKVEKSTLEDVKGNLFIRECAMFQHQIYNLPTPLQWYSSYRLSNVLVTEERFSL